MQVLKSNRFVLGRRSLCCCPRDHGLGLDLEAKFAGLGLGLELSGLGLGLDTYGLGLGLDYRSWSWSCF